MATQPYSSAPVTQYVLVQQQQKRSTQVKQRTAQAISHGAQQVQVPKGLPRILGNQTLIIFAWLVAMALIFADEWKEHHILARPSRLWWTTLVYGILGVVGMIETLAPLTAALAVGYTIVLAWQFFNKSGQFEHASSSSGNGSRGTPV